MDKNVTIVRRNVSTILRDILQHKKLLKKELEESNEKVKGKKINVEDMIKDEHLYFRGESKFYNYRVPTLYRKEKLVKNGSEYYYRTLLNELGKDDYGENTSLVRMISELQHYGAVTRMLDITKSPLIALYFAVEKDDNEPGYIYIYHAYPETEKFDTGHTIAIKCALNFMSQSLIDDFILACESLKENFNKLRNISLDEFMETSDIDDKVKESVKKFMEILNQRAKVQEKLIYPIRIFEDLSKSHLVLPAKTTDRVRQQQGAFIFPKYTNSKGSLGEIQKEISNSISELNLVLKTEKYDEKNKERYEINFNCIKINGGDKRAIRNELEQLGITKGFIYPDIEHVSESLLE